MRRPVLLPAAALLVALSVVAPATAPAVGTPAAVTAASSLPAVDPPVVDPVQVVVERMRPLVPAPGGTLVVAGRVVNTTDAPVDAVSVRLRLSTGPLVSRSEIQAVVDGDPSRDGLSVSGSTVALADTLDARAQQRFRIELPLDSLPFAGTGVFVLGVESLGRRDGVYDRQGLTRTFLPWFPDPEALQPTRLVWLWPLSDWPARDPEGVLLDERTPRELSPGGRLSTLLQSAASQPSAVSWIVDPALLQTVDSMAGGYLVVRDGVAQAGDRADEAADWMDLLRRATGPPAAAPGRDREPRPAPTVRGLPYADVDATALRRGDLDSDVVRAVTSGPLVARAALGRPVTGGLFWAPGGVIDQPTLDVLAAAGIDTVVVSGDALPPDPPLAFTPSGSATLRTSVGSVRAVVTDEGLTTALAMPQRTRGQVVLARQRFLAETGVITTELPATQRTVVTAPGSVLWDPAPGLVRGLLRALATAPWARPSSLDALLAAEPSTVRRDRRSYSPEQRAAELPAGYVERIAAAQQQLAGIGSVVDDPTGITEPYAAALLRSASSAWRSDPRTGGELLRTVEDQLGDEIAQVRVLSRGTVTFSGERGSVPVTVANDLDRPVTVGLRLVGDPPARLESEGVDRVEIEPGRKASIEVPALVIGGGPLPVDVQLVTPEGDDYGDPVRIELRSTAYARAAAWVAGGAFALLAVFVTVGIARRVRTARRSPRGGDSGTVSP